jgi:hypothetical protein
MEIEEVATPEAAPEEEKIVPEGQDTVEAETPEDEEKPSPSKERREREKALKQRLREEAEQARTEAQKAVHRADRITKAGEAIEAPKEADFADYTEYVAAKAVWQHARKSSQVQADDARSEATEAEKRAQELSNQERQIVYSAFAASKEEARARYQDYDQVVDRPGLFPANTHLPDLIVASEMAADLAYVVASDKNLHDTLLKMSPVEAARAIGRMEAQLARPKPRTQTNAPTPISPVKGSAAAVKDPSSMSMDEYIAARKSGAIK